jgi:1-acyl-sn-glycerol-3-phosphate acyltransferase
MLRSLPPVVRGAIAFALLALNVLFWCGLLFAVALVKLVLPFAPVRRRIDPVLNAIATGWIAGNSAWMGLTQRTAWDVAGVEGLSRDDWYLVNCNHQTWVDIFVLQHVFNRRIPLLKFFLKQQLLYVPVMGLAWWALDFPFLRRASKADLRKRPELAAKDREAARRACAKFALVPTSVMVFAEGTRFTPAKHRAQHSPYRHLLKPKTGALASALDAMGDKFHSLLDVTIVYPEGPPTFWRFLCGETSRVLLRAERVPIPPEIREGDYGGDAEFRARFNRWVAQMWEAKDRRIDALRQESAPSRAA